MPLFPFFMNIEGVTGLIVGKGKHAQEKIQRLEPFGPKLRVIPEGEFSENDLEEIPAFVIVAGEDKEENHRIANLCREKRIPVNVVDDQEYCDFVFQEPTSLVSSFCFRNCSKRKETKYVKKKWKHHH